MFRKIFCLVVYGSEEKKLEMCGAGKLEFNFIAGCRSADSSSSTSHQPNFPCPHSCFVFGFNKRKFVLIARGNVSLAPFCGVFP
jgi:hypothetical protein